MAADFSKYLNAPIEDFSAPATPGVGHYFATIKKAELREVNYGQRTGVVTTLTFTLTGADSDVEDPLPPEELRRAVARRDYAMDGDYPQQHVVRAIAEKTLQLPTEGQTFGEVLEAMTGHEVKLYCEHRPDKNDPERVYLEVKKVLPAAE